VDLRVQRGKVHPNRVRGPSTAVCFRLFSFCIPGQIGLIPAVISPQADTNDQSHDINDIFVALFLCAAIVRHVERNLMSHMIHDAFVHCWT
jgi:hypothetical protein